MKAFTLLFLLALNQVSFSATSKLKAKNLENSFSLRKKNSNLRYHYKLHHKNNPFIPPVIADLKPRMEVQIIHELQNYFLSQLKLVGTWKINEKEKRALIMTPDGKSFTIDLRTPIGRKGGRVSAIKENSITVSYFELSASGKKIDKTDFLYLEEKPEVETKDQEEEKTIIIEPSIEENTTPSN